jgi:hypothetical protein
LVCFVTGSDVKPAFAEQLSPHAVALDAEPDMDQLTFLLRPRLDGTGSIDSLSSTQHRLLDTFDPLSLATLCGPGQPVSYSLFSNITENPRTLPTGLTPFFPFDDTNWKHLYGPDRFGFLLVGTVQIAAFLDAYAQVFFILSIFRLC